MILASLDQSSVILQVIAAGLGGEDKTDVASGTVRVYSVSTIEVDLLSTVSLVNVSGSKWRYNWNPSSLAVGQYIVEYVLVDNEGSVFTTVEDLIVRDMATQTVLNDVRSRLLVAQGDISMIRRVSFGRWRIASNQMTIFEEDGTTPLVVFDLMDDTGIASMDRVFERVPVI